MISLANNNFNFTIRNIQGYAFGYNSPCLIVFFNSPEAASSESFIELTKVIRTVFNERNDLDQIFRTSPDLPLPLFQYVSNCFDIVVSQYSLPLFDKVKVLLPGKFSTRWGLAIPVLDVVRHAMIEFFHSIFFMIQKKLQGESVDLQKKINEIKYGFNIERIGSNTPRFMKAAYGLGVQCDNLLNSLMQYGQGKNSAWLDSSFTERTSQISAGLARNKLHAAIILRQMGLPVPEHFVVKNIDQAILFAKKLGFPVVVKPFDLDGGIGVYSDIRTEAELIEAFESTKKKSKNILVEKHIEGRDYRLNVHNDKLLWAIERIPAGVLGDGVSSINELINIINSDERRGVSELSSLKKIQIDKELVSILKAEKKNLGSIPYKNQFIKLTRKANIAAGGYPVSVMDNIHPDNIELAICAARALRLDLAGVDILSPDISKSWLEVGAKICEVNAQPQLGGVTSMHCYGEVLSDILEENGKIPIVVIYGSGLAAALFDSTLDKLNSLFNNVGSYKSASVRLGKALLNKKASAFAAGKALIRNKQTECILIYIDDESFLLNGLPFNRIDYFVFMDDWRTESKNEQHSIPRLKRFFALAQNLVRKSVLISHGELSDNAVEFFSEFRVDMMKESDFLNSLQLIDLRG